jgi:hypothetical protein
MNTSAPIRHVGRWFVSLAAAGLSVALLSATPAAASDYRFVKYVSSIVLEKDGSFVETREVVESPLTRSAIDWIGQVDLSYSQNLAELEVLEAYVLKPDNTRIDVPADAIKLQDDSVSSGAPMFSDEKHKIIVFPHVEIDDHIVYKIRLTQRVAYFPGHFLDTWYFPPDVQVEDARIEISAPAAMPLETEVVDFIAEDVREAGDRLHYAWTYARAEPLDIDTNYGVDRRDYAARLSVSTMRDYKELAAAYEARAADKAAVTPEILKLAKSLTVGTSDRREQARRVYNWVNLNIRYVATYIGAGGYVPHAAADVLKNRYGDCKDHVVLLEALLAAIGIDSSAVIINSDSSFLLPRVPSMIPFNHAITYIPELDLYADSTHFLMPFGVLGARLADKPVMVTKLADPLRRTPVTDPEAAGLSVHTKARINADGSIEGDGKTEFYGSYSDWIRATVADASESQLEEWSTSWLIDAGLQGKSRLTTDDPFALSEPFAIKAEFRLDPMLDLSVPGAFTVPESHIASYNLTGIAGSILESSQDVNVTCGAISLREVTVIELPAEIEILSLPPDMDEESGALSYTSAYERKDRTITVTRALMDRSPHGQCTPAETEDQREIATAIGRDLRRLVLFQPASGL